MSNESEKHEIAVAIIKPDAVREILDRQIEEDIESIGLQVVGWMFVNIPESLVPQIYPDKVGDPLFSSTTWAITSGPSILLLVEGDDSHQKLAVLKGKMNTCGIRHKYCVYPRKKLEEMEYEGKRLYDKLFENRIHTPDNQDESDKLLSLLLTPQQVEGLRVKHPDLHSRVKKYTAIVLVNQFLSEPYPSK